LLRHSTSSGRLWIVRHSEAQDEWGTGWACCVSLPMLFEMLQAGNCGEDLGTLGKIAEQLLLMRPGDDVADYDVADFFERCVDMTVVSRSHNDSRRNHMNLFNMLGIDIPFDLRPTTPISVSVAKKPNAKSAEKTEVPPLEVNQLWVPPPKHAGYDSRLVVETKAGAVFNFYLQAKIKPMQNKSIEEMFADTIYHTIGEFATCHFTDPAQADFSSTHIVVYHWDHNGDDVPEKHIVLEKLTRVNKQKELKLSDPTMRQAATKFIEECYPANVHIMGTETLKKWMLPTLLPVPRLVAAVTEEEKEEDE